MYKVIENQIAKIIPLVYSSIHFRKDDNENIKKAIEWLNTPIEKRVFQIERPTVDEAWEGFDGTYSVIPCPAPSIWRGQILVMTDYTGAGLEEAIEEIWGSESPKPKSEDELELELEKRIKKVRSEDHLYLNNPLSGNLTKLKQVENGIYELWTGDKKIKTLNEFELREFNQQVRELFAKDVHHYLDEVEKGGLWVFPRYDDKVVVVLFDEDQDGSWYIIDTQEKRFYLKYKGGAREKILKLLG